MTQSRTMSLVEAVANVIVGYGVAVITQILIFPIFGLHTTLAHNLKLGAIFSFLCGAAHKNEKMIPIFRFCASVTCSPKTGNIRICVTTATP